MQGLQHGTRFSLADVEPRRELGHSPRLRAGGSDEQQCLELGDGIDGLEDERPDPVRNCSTVIESERRGLNELSKQRRDYANATAARPRMAASIVAMRCERRTEPVGGFVVITGWLHGLEMLAVGADAGRAVQSDRLGVGLHVGPSEDAAGQR